MGGHKHQGRLETEGLQRQFKESFETCHDVWFGDGRAKKKTGGRTEGVTEIVWKREVGYTELRMLKMEPPGRREDSWIETDDLLWRSLKRTAERRGKDM